MPPARILIVDDNRSLAETVADILVEKGFDVDIVSSGAQALTTWRTRPADLLVVDVDLPDIGGLIVARRLSRRHRGCGLVVMSAREPQEAAKLCEELGALFLAKPFSPAHFLATVRLVLEPTSRRRTLPPASSRPARRLLGSRKPRALL